MKQDNGNHAATPGPWKQNGLSITEFGRGIVAVCPTPQNGGCFNCQANARLIAAAPSLLSALEDLIGDLPDMRPPDDSCNFIVCRHCGREYSSYNDLPPPKTALDCSDDCLGHIARAAIAKAKGD